MAREREAPPQVREASYCETHPEVESYLRCSRCERVICPRCMVHTPVGARCRECARLRRLPVFDAGPGDLARSLAAGLAVGLLGGALLSLPGLRFFSFILILVLGYLVGRVVSSAANRKRADRLAAVAAGCTVVGIALGPAVFVVAQAPQLLGTSVPLALALSALANPLRLLLTAVAAVIAWHQVR